MKSPSIRSRLGTLLATLCFALSLPMGAAQPAVQPLVASKWPKWPQGGPTEIKVAGNYAYVAVSGYDSRGGAAFGLAIFDISNPTHLVGVGGYGKTPDIVRSFAVSGNLAYLACNGDGLRVIDVSDAGNCVVVGGYKALPIRAAYDVALSGNYAYMAYGDLQVIDVSNPARCVRVGGYGSGIQAEGVAVSGKYVYLAAGESGLHVIDVSNPTNCVRVGLFNPNWWPHRVVVSGNYAYVTAEPDGLKVIDVSDPANPRLVGGSSRFAYNVAVSGRYAYVASPQSLQPSSVQLIDVSDPTNCVCVVNEVTNVMSFGVAVSGVHAFVTGYDGIQVMVRDSANRLRATGHSIPVSGSAQSVVVAGNHAYVANGVSGLQVLDVSDTATPTQIGGYDTPGDALGVAVSGGYAYVADGEAGFHAIDVRNPTNCVRVGGCAITNGVPGRPALAYQVSISGNHAYVACANAGLQVIDVSNPANCVRVGGFGDVNDSVLSVALSGNHAYLADYGRGLLVIDVSDPADCRHVGGYDTSGLSAGVAVSGNYAYLADGSEGFRVFDVSTRTNCVPVGVYVTSGFAEAVTISGNYAYVTGWRHSPPGLQWRSGHFDVFDISNPTNCVRVASRQSRLTGAAYGLAVSGNRIFLADGPSGLVILPTLPNLQTTVRVTGTPNETFTLETATNLSEPTPWTPLLTTNVSAMPFDFVDFDVKLADKPQKFYRVRQP